MGKIKFLTFVLLALSVFVMSCKKDANNEPETPLVIENSTFKFVVSENYIVENDTSVDNRAWVLIYSLNNELLFEQEIQNGQTYTYEVAEKVKVNVQLFLARYAYYNNRRNFYSLTAYNDVRPDTWSLGTEKNTMEQLGTIQVDLRDINMHDYFISNLRSSKYYGGRGQLTEVDNIYDVPQYYNPDAIWLALFMHENRVPPLYKWVPNLEPNASLSIQHADLDVMSSFEVEYPANDEAMIYIEGDDMSSIDRGFWMTAFESVYESQTSMTAYYPEGVFSDYWTYYRTKLGNVKNYYIYSGNTIPRKMEELNADLIVSNDIINSFEATINGTADCYNSYWNYYNEELDRFQYIVKGAVEPTLNYMAPSIPQTILSLDTELLDLGKLSFSKILLREYSLINGYDDYIKAFQVEHRNMIQQGATEKRKDFSSSNKQENTMSNQEMIKRIKQEKFAY